MSGFLFSSSGLFQDQAGKKGFYFGDNSRDYPNSLDFYQETVSLKERGFFPPDWVREKFPHFNLEKNAQVLNSTGQEFNVDPNILLAFLIVESSDQVNNISPAGAVGPFQIMPETARDLRAEVSSSSALMAKKENLRLSLTDLCNLFDFRASSFLACVYLDKANIPRGVIDKRVLSYSVIREAIGESAVKYHDGLNCDVNNPSRLGKLERERVLGILDLLVGLKSEDEISGQLKMFLDL